MNANAELAARARSIAARAPRGSQDRKAYGCAAVALANTSTHGAARKALDDIDQADIRGRAGALLAELLKEEPDGQG
jgi:hypothetical protein